MSYIASSALYYPIGWIYLWLKYRRKEKVKQVLKENFDGRYYNAGAKLIISIFGIILIGLLSIFLIAINGRIYLIFSPD